MIFIILVGAAWFFIAWLVGWLPCGTVNPTAGCDTAFLPLPTWATDSVTNALGALRWFVYLGGPGIGNAVVVVLSFTLALTTAWLFWDWFRGLPIIKRFLG